MEGKVETNVLTDPDWTRFHSCNIGDERPHSDHSQAYVMVEISQIYRDNERVRVNHTGQRTWLRKELSDIVCE